jgi:hypothetical protein
MPKTPIDYSKCEMYKIVCKDEELDYVYVGHTTNWTKRKNKHKSMSLNSGIKLYQTIRENGGWDNFKMILIETFSCNNKREAEAREDMLMIELKANMNQNCPFRTKKQYYVANKEHIAEWNKQYQEANKERIDKYSKQYREANKEQINARRREEYQADAEKVLEYQKQYYKANKEQILERRKQQYHEANKEKIIEQKKQYYEANKKQIIERNKQYRDANKDRINTRRKELYQAKKEQP